jgi:tetratricopeptide (TPR) repeat protein
LGTTLAKLRRYQEATTFLQNYLDEVSSEHTSMSLDALRLVVNLTWVLSESGKVLEALRVIRKFEAHFSTEPVYSLHRGLQELAAGNFQAARKYLEAFHASWDGANFTVPVPTEYLGAGWWRAMGLCYMGERHYSEAETCFEQCCDLEPTNPEHQLRRLVAGRMIRA